MPSTDTVPGPTVTTTTVPSLAYTIEQGDSLYAIADEFCTDPAAIVALNGWTDGLAHLLRPGDTIALPGPGCVVPTDPPSTTTTLPANPYLALYLQSRVVTDPFEANTTDRPTWGTVCYDAYWSAHYFAVAGLTVVDLLPSLDRLPGSLPPTLLADIDRWAPFSTRWYPVYTDVVGRLQAEFPMYPNPMPFYTALFTDPQYLELLAAYESVGDEQFAAKVYVTDLCERLERTQGSTP